MVSSPGVRRYPVEVVAMSDVVPQFFIMDVFAGGRLFFGRLSSSLWLCGPLYWHGAGGLFSQQQRIVPGMTEFSRKPAHAMPHWQAPTSTGKPAGHRGVARWRAQRTVPVGERKLPLLSLPSSRNPVCKRDSGARQRTRPAPSTVRPLARNPRVLNDWPLPLGFGLDGCLLLSEFWVNPRQANAHTPGRRSWVSP